MAKIKAGSLFSQMSGTFGTFVIAQTQYGAILRRKSSINKKKYAADPMYQRVRDQNEEFGAAGKAAKLLRDSLPHCVPAWYDNRVYPRLMKLVLEIIKTDTLHTRGKRLPHSGNLALLKDFECNKEAEFSHVCRTAYETRINRASGKLSVKIAAFSPQLNIIVPAGATHFQFMACGVAIDFETNTVDKDEATSDLLPVNLATPGTTILSIKLPAKTSPPLFLMLGIRFFSKEHNGFQPLCGKKASAMRIVAVDQK